jgi:hypothetical protein
MPWADATRAVADACRGLAAAHAAGLVHRDVKPANLLSDGAGTVKVTDFGLVRSADLSASQSGRITGTPRYMSPEQCRGEPADSRSDVYALGATFYAQLTGRTPYPAKTPVEVMFAHCSAPVPDPRVVVPDLPAACAAVVRKAMAKEPADRYRTADEMLTALESVAAAGTEAVPAARRHNRRGPQWRRYVAVGFAGVILLGAVLAGVLVGREYGVALDRKTGPGPAGTGEAGAQPGTGDAADPGEPFDPDIPAEGRAIRLGGKVRAVAFSPDGRLFAAGVAEPVSDRPGHPLGVTVWERATGKVTHRLWRGRQVPCLVFKLGGRTLARGGEDGAMEWVLDEQEEKECTRGYGAIGALTADPSGQLVAAGFSDGECRGQIDEWEQSGGSNSRKLGQSKDWPGVHQITYSRDLWLAAAYRSGAVKVWPPGALEPFLINVKSPGGKPSAVAFPPKGPPVLTYTDEASVLLWDCGTRKPLGQLGKAPTVAQVVTFAPDGGYLAVGGEGGEVTLWTVAGQLAQTLRGHQGEVLAIAVSPDGKHLATGSADGTVRLWDLRGALATAGWK